MLSISDHQHVLTVFLASELMQRFLDHFRLVGSPAVQLCSDHDVEILAESEMFQDLFYKYLRFRGRHTEDPALVPAELKELGDPFVDFVFKNSFGRVSLPVLRHRFLRLRIVQSCVLHKHFFQRRPDKTFQLFRIGFFNSEMAQSILNAAGDARSGIGQCSVQIK